MTAEEQDDIEWESLLSEMVASGLTPAAARRRWESQPGLVEAGDAVMPVLNKPSSFMARNSAYHQMAAALAAAKEPNQ